VLKSAMDIGGTRLHSECERLTGEAVPDFPLSGGLGEIWMGSHSSLREAVIEGGGATITPTTYVRGRRDGISRVEVEESVGVTPETGALNERGHLLDLWRQKNQKLQ